MILLDTHIWIWFLVGEKRLKGKIRSRIEAEPALVLISAISVWEAIMLGQRERIIMEPSPVAFVRNALNIMPFSVAPITQEICVLSRELDFRHEDPADRFIAATAHVNQAQLVTEDKRLKNLSWLKTIG